MKGFNVAEVFCEVLGGLAAMVLVILLFDAFKISCLRQSLTFIGTFTGNQLTANVIVAALLLAYIVGLVVDAFGLFFGDWRLDRWLCRDNLPTEEEEKKEKQAARFWNYAYWFCRETAPNGIETARFWNNVPAHVLAYREQQWAYVSAYRNLIILAVPICGLACLSLGREYGYMGVLFPILFTLVLEFAFCKCVSALLKIYYGITKTAWSKTVEPRRKWTSSLPVGNVRK